MAGEAETEKKRTSPGEFMRQVRQEMRRVTWPTTKETWVTSLMVAVMTVIMAVFFLLVDQYFASIVKALVHNESFGTGDYVLVGSFLIIAGIAAYYTLFRDSSR
jgi:preprotein translocase subunit SecE